MRTPAPDSSSFQKYKDTLALGRRSSKTSNQSVLSEKDKFEMQLNSCLAICKNRPNNEKYTLLINWARKNEHGELATIHVLLLKLGSGNDPQPGEEALNFVAFDVPVMDRELENWLQDIKNEAGEVSIITSKFIISDIPATYDPKHYYFGVDSKLESLIPDMSVHKLFHNDLRTCILQEDPDIFNALTAKIAVQKKVEDMRQSGLTMLRDCIGRQHMQFEFAKYNEELGISNCYGADKKVQVINKYQAASSSPRQANTAGFLASLEGSLMGLEAAREVKEGCIKFLQGSSTITQSRTRQQDQELIVTAECHYQVKQSAIVDACDKHKLKFSDIEKEFLSIKFNIEFHVDVDGNAVVGHTEFIFDSQVGQLCDEKSFRAFMASERKATESKVTALKTKDPETTSPVRTLFTRLLAEDRRQ